jgi:hypothetical protein
MFIRMPDKYYCNLVDNLMAWSCACEQRSLEKELETVMTRNAVGTDCQKAVIKLALEDLTTRYKFYMDNRTYNDMLKSVDEIMDKRLV